MQQGTNTYYYHTNSLGSVIAITDGSGTVAERYEYDAYGKPSIYNSTYILLPGSSIGNVYMFTGREYDAESGLYYYRARHYSPILGRFMQQDPIGVLGDDINLGNAYTYVGNNPVNKMDPTGNRPNATPCTDARNLGHAGAFGKYLAKTVLCGLMTPGPGLICLGLASVEYKEDWDQVEGNYKTCMKQYSYTAVGQKPNNFYFSFINQAPIPFYEINAYRRTFVSRTIIDQPIATYVPKTIFYQPISATQCYRRVITQ